MDYEAPNFLKVPEPLIQKKFSRIMSLKDGTKKMSKSDPSDLSRINMTDTKDQIVNKIKKAKRILIYCQVLIKIFKKDQN